MKTRTLFDVVETKVMVGKIRNSLTDALRARLEFEWREQFPTKLQSSAPEPSKLLAEIEWTPVKLASVLRELSNNIAQVVLSTEFDPEDL